MEIWKRVVIALLFWAVSGQVVTHADDRPNILLIYVDDLGYGDLASFGHPVIETPNLDRLAREGMTLTNYYAPSALCSPSRAGLMTGRMPYRTGIKAHIPGGSGIYLSQQEITVAESLKSAGYATALIGKWHLNSDLGNPNEPQPTDQGFDYFYGHNAFQRPTNKDPHNIYRNGEKLPIQKGYTAQLYADEAIQWLSAQGGDQPFFLFLGMAEPHTTFENPPAYNEKYSQFTKGDIIPLPNGVPPDKKILTPRGPGEYYANVTYMDHQIGRVLDWLDTRGLTETTVVLFTSDNGPVTAQWLHWWEVNAYGSTGGLRGRKHMLFDGGIKVPAIIRYPGVTTPGTVSDELVVGTDVFPTLAAIAGAPVPDDRPIDGIDIQRIFSGQTLGTRTVAWALETDLEFVIRRGDWKLMLDRNRTPRFLFNLGEDPLELFNLIENEPEQVKKLTAAFNAYFADIE